MSQLCHGEFKVSQSQVNKWIVSSITSEYREHNNRKIVQQYNRTEAKHSGTTEQNTNILPGFARACIGMLDGLISSWRMGILVIIIYNKYGVHVSMCEWNEISNVCVSWNVNISLFTLHILKLFKFHMDSYIFISNRWRSVYIYSLPRPFGFIPSESSFISTKRMLDFWANLFKIKIFFQCNSINFHINNHINPFIGLPSSIYVNLCLNHG